MKRRSDHRSTNNNKSTRDAAMDEFYGFKQFNQQPPTLSSSSSTHNHNNHNDKNTKTRRTNIVGSREYFDEAAKWMEQHEQQQQQHENHRDASSKRISDRETHYQSRWRKRELSPDRIDPFSPTTTTTTTATSSRSSSSNKHKTSSSSSNKRSYSEIYQESALDREKADLENQLKRKQMNKQLLSAAKAHATATTTSSTSTTATHTHNPNDEPTSEVTSQHKQRKTSSSPSLPPQSSTTTTTTTINHNDDNNHNNNNNNNNTDNNTNVHINYKPSGLLYNYQQQQQQQTSTGGDGGGGGNVEEEEEAKNNMMTSSWNDPPESRIPTGQKWRLYVMRDGNEIEKPIHLIHQKSFLFGRDRNTVDVPIDHLSCSKLHAVICFRLCSSSTTHKKHQKKSREDSEQQSVIKPFLMDMKSTNGTMLNGKRVEDCRFYELRNNDLIQFGHSTREYILIDERLALEEE